jgi:hypothetical protein
MQRKTGLGKGLGTTKIIFSEDELAIVANMSKWGSTLKLISQSLGCSEETLHDHPEILELHRKHHSGMVSMLQKTAIQKAADGDPKMIEFVLKMQGFWRSGNAKDMTLTGDYDKDRILIKRELKRGNISVCDYTQLSKALADEFSQSEMVDMIKETQEQIKELQKQIVKGK